MTEETENHNAKEVRDWVTDKVWFGIASAIVVVAAFLRLFNLELKPLHHDEGVNGHFLTTLFREGTYSYDPSNYHGPDLYYLSLVFTKLFGLNTLSVRWSVVVFGLLTVVLTLYLRRYIGSIGSLVAAAFLALSPGMVYVSRYFIHEILFVFLSLAIVVAVLFFKDKQKAGVGAAIWMTLTMAVSFLPVAYIGITQFVGRTGLWFWVTLAIVFTIEAILIFFVLRMLFQWQQGRPIYLILASVSAVMLFATKETAFITHGTMLIAAACVYGWFRLFESEKLRNGKRLLALVLAGIAAISAIGVAIAGYQRGSNIYQEFYAKFGGDVGQSWLFFLIVLLGIASVLAYIFYLVDGKVSDQFTEPLTARLPEDWNKLDSILSVFASVFVFVFLLAIFFTGFFQKPGEIAAFFEAYAFWAKTSASDHTQAGLLGYVKWMLQIESPIVFLSVLGTVLAAVRIRSKFALFAGVWAFGLFLAYTIISYKTPWLALSFTLPMALVGGYAIEVLLSFNNRTYRFIGVAILGVSTLILSFQTYDLNFVRYDDSEMPYVYAHTYREFEDLIEKTKEVADKSSRGTNANIQVVSPEYWPMPWYLNDYPNAVFHGKLAAAGNAEVIIANKKQMMKLPELYAREYKYIGEFPLRPGEDLILLVRNDLAGETGKNLYEIR